MQIVRNCAFLIAAHFKNISNKYTQLRARQKHVSPLSWKKSLALLFIECCSALEFDYLFVYGAGLQWSCETRHHRYSSLSAGQSIFAHACNILVSDTQSPCKPAQSSCLSVSSPRLHQATHPLLPEIQNKV